MTTTKNKDNKKEENAIIDKQSNMQIHMNSKR